MKRVERGSREWEEKMQIEKLKQNEDNVGKISI